MALVLTTMLQNKFESERDPMYVGRCDAEGRSVIKLHKLVDSRMKDALDVATSPS